MKRPAAARFDSLVLPLTVAALLLVVLAVRQDSVVHAAMSEDRGDYLVVSGASGLGDDQLLWILDTRAEELTVAGWDSGAKGVRGFGTRSVQRDLQHMRQQR